MAFSAIGRMSPAMIAQPLAARDESKELRRVNSSRSSDTDNSQQQMNPQSAPANTQAEAQLASKRAQALKENQSVANELSEDTADRILQLLQLNIVGGRTRGVLVDLLA